MQITLNLTPGGVPPKINVKQGDKGGKTLVLHLIEGSEEYQIPEDATVVWQGTKPDKYGFSYDCTFDGSTVTVPITTQSTAVVGDVACELMITEGESNNIRTATATMIVAAAALPDDTIISGDDYQSAANFAAAAAASAVSAAASAETASTAIAETATNASAAANSATSAASSATNAATSETNAAASESAVETSKNSAETAATSAAASASSAAESATSAAASAALAASIAQGQKGYYATPEALEAAYPTGTNGDWAIVGTTDTVWIWDSDTSAWINSGNAIDLSGYDTSEQADAKYATKTALAETNGNISDIRDGTSTVASATTATTATTADNGIATYAHSYADGVHALTGSGANGKFIATVTGIASAFTIESSSYAVVQGSDNDVYVTEGKNYNFTISENTINFAENRPATASDWVDITDQCTWGISVANGAKVRYNEKMRAINIGFAATAATATTTTYFVSFPSGVIPFTFEQQRVFGYGTGSGYSISTSSYFAAYLNESGLLSGRSLSSAGVISFDATIFV